MHHVGLVYSSKRSFIMSPMVYNLCRGGSLIYSSYVSPNTVSVNQPRNEGLS